MDRREWGEIVGDKDSVEDDLRWELFQAERCMTSSDRDADSGERPKDRQLYHGWERAVRDLKCALAALWQRDEQRYQSEDD